MANSQRKGSMDGDLDLSLTGSQVSALSSGRRPGSAKSSARCLPSGGKTNPVNGGLSQRSTKPRSRSNSQTLPLDRGGSGDNARNSARKTNEHVNSASTPKGSAREDFLALFEQSTQPKIMKPRPQARKPGTPNKSPPKKAWGSDTSRMNSARSIGSEGDKYSHTSGKSSKYSHSIFMPDSARTTSTLADEDYHLEPGPSQQPPLSPKNGPSLNSRAGKHSGKEDHSLGVATEYNPNSLGQDDKSLSRNSLHNDIVKGRYHDNSSQKSQKLNSLANNMTSQAMSPGTKTPLVDMENSYQNIKHKMPVNQVKQSSHSQGAMGRNLAEDNRKACDMAATKIQRWFRRQSCRGKAGQAALKRMMEAKRQEKAEELERERRQPTFEQKAADDRKRIREEKARAARQEAIKELQKKREEKRKENQKIAEEEIKFLQASGKVSKTPSDKNNMKKKPTPLKQNQRQRRDDSDSDQEKGASARRPVTSGSTGRKAEDFFQQNSARKSPQNFNHNDESEEESLNGNLLESDRNGEGAAASQSATKTTLDDLMETLKKLEEDEKLPPGKKDRNENPNSWFDNLDKHTSDGENADYLTSEKLEKLHPDKDNLKKSGYLSDEKLKSIINFLDEVEVGERLDDIDQEIAKSSTHDVEPIAAPPLVPSGEELAQMEQASLMASEVTSQMLNQRLDLDEKKRTIKMLQQALNQQRELTVRHAKETEKEMKKRLDVQKEEYEETIKRHLSFIDQLIDDKKSLGEKCEHLVKELKTVDKKFQDKIKVLTDNHTVEMQKVKDIHAAAEKLRREKWIDEKTKKIKEMTVKGLEPEIQRLIAKHKAEIKKLKSIHEAEMLHADERAGGRYVNMTEELRDQLAKEKEAACARERELARQTYEKQMQQEEEAYQQQRRRLYAEVAEEKERLSSQAARQRAEIDKLQRQLEDSHSNASEAMKKEYEKAREEQERRHTTEIRQLREQLSVEKAAWEENYKKKQETWLLQKERELKENVRKERDKEIEMVIQRLEDDSQATRDECERVAENRIKRIRDKYESEMAELERNERQITEKYNQLKAKNAELEGELERIKVILKQRDKKIVDLKKLLDRLNNERDHVSDVIRQEFADKLVATDEENKRLKNEMSELKARHKVELQRQKAEIEVLQKAKEEEMEEVHKRVKAAIVKKEEVVTQLKQQHQAALKRADHLEGLLDQQRKQLLKK